MTGYVSCADAPECPDPSSVVSDCAIPSQPIQCRFIWLTTFSLHFLSLLFFPFMKYFKLMKKVRFNEFRIIALQLKMLSNDEALGGDESKIPEIGETKKYSNYPYNLKNQHLLFLRNFLLPLPKNKWCASPAPVILRWSVYSALQSPW